MGAVEVVMKKAMEVMGVVLVAAVLLLGLPVIWIGAFDVEVPVLVDEVSS